MSRTYDALQRAEREREQRDARGESSQVAEPPPTGRGLWGRILARRPDPAMPRLEAAILRLGGQIDALDERITKQLPETEGRLLHVLEKALAGLRSELASGISRSVAEEIARKAGASERRDTSGRAVIIALLLAVLITLIVR